jgi:hypothetical protein
MYFDTSVINFLFADEASDFRRVTEEFFARYARENDARFVAVGRQRRGCRL